MPDSERFHLDRPPVPKVQQIMGHQIIPEKRLVLAKTQGLIKNAELVEELNSSGVRVQRDTPFSLLCTQLVKSGLLERTKPGVYQPTTLGQTASEALIEYRRGLIDPMFEMRAELLKTQPGHEASLEELAAQREALHSEISFPLSLQKIMAYHSGSYSLVTLLSIPLPESTPANNKAILLHAKDVFGLDIPSAQFREIMRGLMHNLLVLPRNTSINARTHTLSSLGVASLQAYNAYQEKVSTALEA